MSVPLDTGCGCEKHEVKIHKIPTEKKNLWLLRLINMEEILGQYFGESINLEIFLASPGCLEEYF